MENHKLLTREAFKVAVFKRDHNTCVLCKNTAVDAHHLLDRKLFDDGGYYLNNGVSVCAEHHWQCETTEITVAHLRTLAQIKEPVLPIGFNKDNTYDKWGNQLVENGLRQKGPLFNDTGCQKALKQKLWMFI